VGRGASPSSDWSGDLVFQVDGPYSRRSRSGGGASAANRTEASDAAAIAGRLPKKFAKGEEVEFGGDAVRRAVAGVSGREDGMGKVFRRKSKKKKRRDNADWGQRVKTPHDFVRGGLPRLNTEKTDSDLFTSLVLEFVGRRVDFLSVSGLAGKFGHGGLCRCDDIAQIIRGKAAAGFCGDESGPPK